jgi:hypothetical protein
VELELLGAGIEQIHLLKRQLAALGERAQHADRVALEVEHLHLRLETAAVEIEALSVRLGADLGSEALLHEVRAWHSSTDQALRAFADTVGEL